MVHFKNKKAVTSVATFSLLIVLMLLVFSSSYWFYTHTKTNAIVSNKNMEIQNSLLTFRSQLLNLAVYENSKLNYENKYDSPALIISLENKSIIGKEIINQNIVTVEITSLGVPFCENYTFSPATLTIFQFNGNCVSRD